jgi:hypothetical protein
MNDRELEAWMDRHVEPDFHPWFRATYRRLAPKVGDRLELARRLMQSRR